MIDLRDYSGKVWSQRGEDGIIEKIFSTIEINSGYAVELGAWDGIKYSNVYNLVQKGWSATLIEGDSEKYDELTRNMKSYPNVKTCNRFVSLESGSTLSEILTEANAPHDFDILSLDLDGIDYWVWDELTFRPKLVVIEYNSNWEDSKTIAYNKDHCWDGTQYYGASASALNGVALERGYDLVSHVPNTNLFFLDKRYNSGKFQILDLSTGFHISKNHHAPMTEKQSRMLVINPRITCQKVF
jgi:hypothetical protein